MKRMADWKSGFERLKRKQENEEERQHELVSAGLDHTAAYLGGSIVAYLNGRKGGMPAIAKIPIDVISAGVSTLLGLGLLVSGRSYGRHVAAFGIGPGVWWMGGLWAKYGQKKRREAGEMLSTYDANGNLVSYLAMNAGQEETAGVQQRPPITAGAPRGSLLEQMMQRHAA